MEAEIFTEIAKTAPGILVVGGIALHLIKVWLPKETKRHREDIEKASLRHQQDAERQRDDFKGILTEQRTFFCSQIEREREMVDKITESLKELATYIRQTPKEGEHK